jgi:anthranilate phosphoribosyltransferase
MSDAPDLLLEALKRILEARETLTRDEARALLGEILDRMQPAEADPVRLFQQHIRIAGLLGALAARGETTAELAGFVDAFRAKATPMPLTDAERSVLVDTCGTGGDLSGTFNISTAAALVASAAGASVAKHGNRAVTSKCGSADVLEALGIPVDLTPEAAAKALRTYHFAFLSAPSLQPAMKAIMPIRRALGVRTAFNILGPMSNPAGAPAQVMGVYSEHPVPIVANTLAALNTRHAFVVHGGGMDEFSISGPTTTAEIRNSEVFSRTVMPADFGLAIAPIETLAGGSVATNAAILRAIFAGERSPRRDVVVMNAAAVLITANLANNFLDAARLAERTIDSGKVTQLVATLIDQNPSI